MSSIVSEGQCHLCGLIFPKSVMTRHLQACLVRRSLSSLRHQKTFWLFVEGQRRPMYWMYIEAPIIAKLSDLDQFLRDVWLECCHHMSAFVIGDVFYEAELDEEGTIGMDFFGPDEILSMNVTLEKVLTSGLKFTRENDRGSTTKLTLRVIGEQERDWKGREITILARNLPPKLVCGICGRPAQWVCSVCIHEGRGFLCSECVSEHTCGEEMLLPVVNSPHMGECGYVGLSRS